MSCQLLVVSLISLRFQLFLSWHTASSDCFSQWNIHLLYFRLARRRFYRLFSRSGHSSTAICLGRVLVISPSPYVSPSTTWVPLISVGPIVGSLLTVPPKTSVPPPTVVVYAPLAGILHGDLHFTSSNIILCFEVLGTSWTEQSLSDSPPCDAPSPLSHSHISISL